MTAEKMRDFLVEKALTREGKNQYSQDPEKRTMIESGYGDCSGTVWYWYYKLFAINIGGNTEAQINSPKGTRIDVNITNGIPDFAKCKKGDLFYFRGKDNSRTEGVGHVEMYIGNNKLFGHGSGIGGTVKDATEYCRLRQKQTSTEKLKNKGLICVKRFIADEPIEELTKVNDIVWELAHRGIITQTDLWLKKLDDDINAYWLARKVVHYLRNKNV